MNFKTLFSRKDVKSCIYKDVNFYDYEVLRWFEENE
jgi:hypothetical protein